MPYHHAWTALLPQTDSHPNHTSRTMQAVPVVVPERAPSTASLQDQGNLPGRFAALDIFRGLTIAGMILVNTPGSWSYVYAPLRHAQWHGWTPTDLVFPFFLFITGCAMWFSFRKFEQRPSSDLLLKIAKRVALIFAVGLALNVFPFTTSLADLRIPGVLQRIALAYGAAAVLCLYLTRTRLMAASAVLLIGYWPLLLAFGGADPYGLETNFARQVDLALLGAAHVYKGFGVPFDPEGLLSTIPAVVTVIGGYFAGRLLGSAPDRKVAVTRLLVWGAAAAVAGLIWSLVFPINKPLWTSSYVLLTGGLAALVLAAVVWLVDLRGLAKWGMPFTVFGLNPLFSYVLSGVLVDILISWVRIGTPDGSTINGYTWLYTQVFAPLAGPMNGSLLFAVTFVLACWCVAYVLYRRRIFIRL